MLWKRSVHPTVKRMGKKEALYAIMGFLFAAVEMQITSISYFFPAYQSVVYGIMLALLIFWILLLLFRKNHITPKSLNQLGLLFAVCVCGMIASVYNGENWGPSVTWMMSLLLIPVFFLTFESEMPFAAIKGIAFYCRMILIIYLISVVLFREQGMYLPGGNSGDRKYYFLGHVNSSVKLAVPALVVFAVMDIWKTGKIRKSTWFFTIITLAAQFYTESYVAAVGMFIYALALYIFSRKKTLMDRLPKWSPLALSGLIFLIIVAARSLFQSVIQFGAMFGRSMSIVTRGIIWNLGFSAVENNLVGYGPLCDYSKLMRIGTYYPSTAHNIYLDAAIQTGVVGAALFTVFLFLMMKNMPSWKKWPVIPAALFAYAVMWNFEPYFVNLYLQCTLLPLFLMFHLPRKMENSVM